MASSKVRLDMMIRCERKCSYALSILVIVAMLGASASLASAQLKEATEAELIGQVAKLSAPGASQSTGSGDYFSSHEKAITAVDELLRRFPKSVARSNALVTKLRLLADLSRFNPQPLKQLLALTEEISRSHPEPKLDMQNRWYAIQAFVYGARAEGMPGKLRLSGVMERYRAYITDFPESPRRPIAYASLIRNLVLSEKIEEAASTLKQFAKDYPDDINTLIAQEEVLRPQLLGKPFEVIYTARDGRKISTKDDFQGKVLVIEYWSGNNTLSTNIWADLMYMFTRHSSQGLQMLGMSIDHDPELMKKVFKRDMTPWPNGVEQKVIHAGSGKILDIFAVPCFIVLDRDGVVYDINHGVELEDVVKELLYK